MISPEKSIKPEPPQARGHETLSPEPVAGGCLMSWQEELRRLDADLSAGRIGHAEHRRKREELLAEASGGGAASPVASPLRPAGSGNAGVWPVAEPAAGRWKGEPPVRWASGPDSSAAQGGPSSFGGQSPGSPSGQGDSAEPGQWANGSDTTDSMPSPGRSEANPMTGAESAASANSGSTTASAQDTADTSGAATAAGAAAGASGTADTTGTAGASSGAAGAAGATSATGHGTWSSANPATQPAAQQPTVQQLTFQQSTVQLPTAEQQSTAQQQTVQQPTWHPVQQGAGEQPSEDGKSGKPAKSPKQPKAPKPAKGFRASKGSIAQTPSWEPKAVGDFHTNRRTTAPSPADLNPTDLLDISGANFDKQFDQQDKPPTPELRQLWEEGPPRRKRPTWLFLSLGVLLALVLIVGLTWYIGSKPDQRGTADSVSAPPVPSPSGSANPSATLEDKLPALTGKPSQDNSTMSLDKAVELKAISQADADLMKTAGADELVYRSYADADQADNGTVLLAVPTGSSAQAEVLVKGLQGNLVGGGFESAALGPAPTDLLYSGSSPAGRVLAFWYTSGPVAIGIGASQPLAGDAAALRSRIEQIRTKVAAALPAG
jgi:hypothetical protein